MTETTQMKERIKRLEEQVWELRYALVGMTPTELRWGVLNDYHSCRMRRDLYDWKQRVIKAVVEYAKPDNNGRAACPLCGHGTLSGGGWLLPIGLECHLEGSHNASDCDVMKAAVALVRDTLRDTVINAR